MAETAPKPKSSVATRAASAAVLIPVALAAVWAGGPAFAVFTLIAGLLMAWEWSRMVFEPRHVMQYSLLIGGAVAIAALAAYAGLRPIHLYSLLVFWAACVVLAFHHKAGKVGWAVPGLPYICLPVFALIALRGDGAYGLMCVVWLLLVIWATDTAAFFVGRSVGGPKLAPAISPNKTWSGSLGGLVAAALVGLLTAYYAGLEGVVGLVLMSMLISVVGQIGDLIESALKRRFGVKDSSNLIPGHGGVLDRLDSLITASVAALVIGAVRNGPGRAAEGVLVWQW